ncbi:MAG: hypothetical protein H6686_10705 [Fibrobacteria bacterium]|nr:hypothetical protein [Fibrobacteria bacterium]
MTPFQKPQQRLGKILLPVLAMALGAPADSWTLQGGGTADDLGLVDIRSVAIWHSEETTWGWPSLEAGWHRFRFPSLAALPEGGGDEVSLKGAWIDAFGPVRAKVQLGLDDLADPSSWRGGGRADWYTGAMQGMRATARLETGPLGGIRAEGVRVSHGALALGWDGPRTWAEVGVSGEDRSGGTQPEGNVSVDLSSTQVGTLWAWGTRQWWPWLQAGLSASATHSTRATHQAVFRTGDGLQWTDAPYESPRERMVAGGLLKMSHRGAWVSTTWPIWSTERLTVENPDVPSPVYEYTQFHVAQAEVRGGYDLTVAGKAVVGMELSAVSKPYLAGAWFTGDAWNQFGATLTVRFATP